MAIKSWLFLIKGLVVSLAVMVGNFLIAVCQSMLYDFIFWFYKNLNQSVYYNLKSGSMILPERRDKDFQIFLKP